MPLGVYISVPFCRSKCSFCNFASGVFSRSAFEGYVERVCEDIRHAETLAATTGGSFEAVADSIYLGGGTPTVLEPEQLQRIFDAVRNSFEVTAAAEITVECAPASLSDAMLETLVRCGANRASLGVQSFVDAESRAVGRLHTRAATLDDIARLRAASITEISIDLIAGLPHQTAASWRESLEQTLATGATHASVYMLEVDEDSRLGKELIAGGTRYHAHFVPDEDVTADFYEAACTLFDAAGLRQYEISNFARRGHESRHNLGYWLRQPYLGFGVDAHSMLDRPDGTAVRFATSDTLEEYSAGAPLAVTQVSRSAALEEEFFLGLRLRDGVDLDALAARYAALPYGTIESLVGDELLARKGSRIWLTPRGRLLSNEVFQRFITEPATEDSQAAPRAAIVTIEPFPN